jgi:hypothetical protein
MKPYEDNQNHGGCLWKVGVSDGTREKAAQGQGGSFRHTSTFGPQLDDDPTTQLLVG